LKDWLFLKIVLPTFQFAKPEKKAKAPRKTTPKSKPASKKNASQPAKKADPDSFFAFGNNDSDNDNDSDEEMSSTPNPAPITKADMGSKQAAFTLGGLGGHSDDEDDDIPEDGIAASWNISKESIDEKMDGDDDDDWGAAREEAAAAKAREEDKKKREEKMQAEAEEAKRQRMADATAKGEEIRAQRMEEEEKEAKIQEQKEKEAEEQRKKIREEARAKAEGLEATVDLDAQRDIMKQYEQSFLDKELGSASPSSDFGF
jgi:outer membrane biosynthesis protein TonB